MAMSLPFPQAGFLRHLEHLDGSAAGAPEGPLPPLLERLLRDPDGGRPTSATHLLANLLKARQAMLQAAHDTELAADELRRYQKFARPGQPSMHTVQLRQRQASARQAASLARQSFNKAAASFVHETGIAVPARTALEAFAIGWIDTHVPADTSRPDGGQ